MDGDVKALRARNDRAAARELAELRADTVKGLKYALSQGGVDGVLALLTEAGVLVPLFDRFAGNKRRV
jgi:hypothetical protein